MEMIALVVAAVALCVAFCALYVMQEERIAVKRLEDSLQSTREYQWKFVDRMNGIEDGLKLLGLTRAPKVEARWVKDAPKGEA